MAERISETSYLAMIEALYHFSSRTAEIGGEIQTAANVCRNALTEEDSGVLEIYRNVTRCQTGYSELARQAAHIARTMAEELQRSSKEQSEWESED